jgi:hypothetical protein
MDHEEQIAEAHAQILELERERLRIEDKINRWRTVIDTYRQIDGKSASSLDSSLKPLHAIRSILADHPEGLTPRQIREQLLKGGINISHWVSPLANIHSLIKKDRQIEMIGIAGMKYYRLRPGVSE